MAVLAKPVPNSSVWIGVKKAHHLMQGCFQHFVMKMFPGVCSDQKEVKRANRKSYLRRPRQLRVLSIYLLKGLKMIY